MNSTSPLLRPTLRGGIALALAVLAQASAHASAIDDWQSAASACTPINASTLGAAFIPTNGAYVRAPLGPNPPMTYVCNVLDSFATAVPTWKYLQLQYLDPVGGAVRARLYQKDKVTGTTVLLTTATSAAAVPVSVVSTPVPAMNFAINSYHVVITLTPQTAVQVQAHMVTLTQ